MTEVKEKKNAGATTQIIVFKLGGEEYALEIDKIKEVVPTPPISKVPLTPDFVKGVANIRGSILAIIDLEEKFELVQNKTTIDSQYTLVVDSEDLNMAILVKEVPNTLSVSLDDIDSSPSIIQESSSEQSYIKGIVKLDKRLIILINLDAVISKGDLKNILV
ncbi:MAG: purine-binding chemotaxis protein CheW [Flammeovirgaceae bacterium]|jgi:purine-binding chemotaxis protein CheW